jgi:hypothetical protein
MWKSAKAHTLLHLKFIVGWFFRVLFNWIAWKWQRQIKDVGCFILLKWTFNVTVVLKVISNLIVSFNLKKQSPQNLPCHLTLCSRIIFGCWNSIFLARRLN